MLKKLFAERDWLPYLAPDTGADGGVYDDDGTTDDDPADFSEEELRALLEDEPPENDDDDSEGDEGTPKEEPPDDTPPEPPKSEEKMIPQSEVDRIIGERLARERRVQEEKLAQEEAAKKQQEEFDKTFSQRFQTRYQFHMQKLKGLGYEEEAAVEMAKSEAQYDVENEIRIYLTEQRAKEFESKQQQTAKLNSYLAEKTQAVAKTPMAAKYLDEIDAFSQNGEACSFQTALAFVLGEKLLSGDLLETIKATTEQKTLANVNKRSKMSVEKGPSAASTGEKSLTREELMACQKLGVSPKVYAKNKK